MNRLLFLSLVASSHFLVVHANAQVRPASETLGHNLARLNCDIAVDKPLYFVGEEQKITLRIWNPTSVALTVPTPFSPDQGVVWAPDLNDQGDMYRSRPVDDHGEGSISNQTPITTLAAGEERLLNLLSSVAQPINEIHIPMAVGRFGIHYEYKGCLQRFRTVRPTLEALAQARFPYDITTPGDDLGSPPETDPWYRWVFSLRRDGVSYIGVQRHGSTTFVQRLPVPANLGPVDERVASMLGWYKLVGSTPEVVSSIQASMDNLENLIIIYTTASGTQTRIDLNKDLNPR